MTREQLEISIQSNMPTNGVGFITAEHTRQVAHDLADYVDSEVEGVEVDVTDLENRMTQAETDIDNLETRMDTAEGDIDSLEDRVGITEQDISQLKPVVAQHTIDINNLDNRMDTAEDDIDALETRVDGISGDVSGLDSRVDTLEDKVDVLEPKVDQNTADIDNLKTRVAQNERDINSLDDRVDAAEGDIDNIEGDLNIAQRDITNLQGRMQRAEGDIQNIEANHYTKVESDGRYEQLMNKATDFTVINDVKYPTTKAVADYVSTVAPNEIYYTTTSDTYANVKAAVAANKFVILKYVNALVPLARVYNAGQANEYYVFVGHFTNESAVQIILNNTGWQQATTLALTNTIEGYETAENLLPSAKAVADYAYKKQANGIPKTDLAEDVQESLDKADTAIQEEDLVNYAKVDGYYEGMGVGTADNLTGQTERTDDAMYRKTGGSEEVASGTATITNIKGQTVVWNQIVNYSIAANTQTVNGITFTKNGDGTYTANGTSTSSFVFQIIRFQLGIILGHKYILLGCPASGSNSTYYLNDGLFQDHIDTGAGVIWEASSSTTSVRVYVRSSDITMNNVIFKPQIIDLTLIYGAGNEPTTPEQFEADYFKWFGKPLTYEDYDEGSLRSVQLDSLKTTGFNQWNGNYTAHKYIDMQGNFSNTNNYNASDYIRVLPSEEYCINYPMYQYGPYVALYDINKDFKGIRFLSSETTNYTFRIPDNVYYIRANIRDENLNKFCINISNSDKNGTYEPYEEHSVSLPVTTITGKLNGGGESVVVFPDGMKSAGTAYDEIYTVGDKTYAVKRIGSVDMGRLNWSYNSDIGVFITGNIASITGGKEGINYLNGKYVMYFTYSFSVGIDYAQNNTKILVKAGNASDHRLFIADPSYTSVAQFKAAMNGVMLYYELATPRVYELDTFDLPKPYQVDADGTEEQIQKSGVQGLAAILTILYGVDAVKILDKLPQNYISEASMDNFLAQLNTVTGGTWTKTWNENTGEWDFSFTPNAQTNDTNTDETI